MGCVRLCAGIESVAWYREESMHIRTEHQRPLVSVIIPAYCAMATIEACLASLAAQDFGRPFEVIVVDSSSDRTAELAQKALAWARVVCLPRKTDPATARNLGAAFALAPLLAFLDADCIAAPDWLRRLEATISSGYDAVGGAIANANAEYSVSRAGYLCEFREFLPGGPARDVENITLGNAAYRADLFWDCGGFPAGFFPQEDQVFHQMFRAAGGRIRLEPDILVAHHHRDDNESFLHHQRQIGQANARVLHRVRLPGAWLVARPWLLAVMLPALVPYRFVRTLAHAHFGNTSFWREKHVIWLCWQGMWAWGCGFLEGAAAQRNNNAIAS